MNVMSKRAQQTGGPAVTLITAITLLLIAYILFLPPAEREALLEGDNVTTTSPLQTSLLLDESPGKIKYTEKTEIDHNIANVFLATRRNAKVLARLNPVSVKKGWFSDERRVAPFALSNLDRTENIILSFQTKERRGILSVKLNGQLIFEGEIKTQNPPPIPLPKSALKDINEIEFSVKGGFFSKKKYVLDDIKIIGDIISKESQSATSTFTISKTERENLKSASLDYYPLCEQENAGLITITLNGKIISSAIPSCNGLNRQDLYKEDLLEGKNVITWNIEKGAYRIEQIRVRTTLEGVDTFIDYFGIDSQLYNQILDKKKSVVLRIEFVDDQNKKEARLSVNGKFDSIDQEDPIFEKDITSLVREGNNYLEIKPLTELNIARIAVRAE
ncbi:hypothetical protein D6825_01040 [Candidatus Woesearchaeota archaeon]|nr:MAG: hypothetical protein D6825_01040 [Candidatus Woesearchaeota archaeon]